MQSFLIFRTSNQAPTLTRQRCSSSAVVIISISQGFSRRRIDDSRHRVLLFRLLRPVRAGEPTEAVLAMVHREPLLGQRVLHTRVSPADSLPPRVLARSAFSWCRESSRSFHTRRVIASTRAMSSAQRSTMAQASRPTVSMIKRPLKASPSPPGMSCRRQYSSEDNAGGSRLNSSSSATA